MVKTHVEESLGANPGDAALNPADSVAMGVPSSSSPLPTVGDQDASSATSRTAESARASTFRALRHRPFRLLFFAFLVNQTGFWISHISLQGLMVDLSRNDTRQNGLLFFFLFLPAFALAPVAGVAADRFDRKRIMLACYAAIATTSGVLAALTAAELVTPPIVLGIAFALGTAFAFSGPASLAIAANSVPAGDLSSAVSLQSAANNLTRVVGPLLAAPLLASGRYEVSFAIYLVASSLAGLLTAVMQITPYVPEQQDGGIWDRIRSGFDHARERHPALPALATVAMMSFFGVSHAVLVPAYARDVLGGAGWFAWLVAATGLGAMLGALQSGRTRALPSLPRAAWGLCAYAVALAVFALTTRPSVALVAQGVVGYFYFAVMTSLQTLIQQLVDEARRGRVMSLFQVCWAGFVPFGSLAMGALAKPLGTPATIAAAAGVCLVYGVSMLIVASRWREPA